MTTPVVAATGIPPLNRVVPPAAPAPGGLYSAATITDLPDPSRLSGGILAESRNLGAHGLWPAECGDPGDQVKGGDFSCPGLTDFPATVVWASGDRKLPGTSEEDARLAALQTLRITEQLDVEAHLAPLLVDRAGIPATAAQSEGSTIVAALGAVEQAASGTGMPLVIHAPRSAAAAAASKGLVVAKGTRLYTPLGNQWSFGAGYTETLAGLLVATGPVTVERSPIVESVGLNLPTNDRDVIAERVVVVTWDGPAAAAAFA